MSEFETDIEEAKAWIEGFRTLGAGDINLLIEFHPWVIAAALRQIADEWDAVGDELEADVDESSSN